MSLTLLTPSMPGRANLLGQMLISVAEQTVQPYQHLIRVKGGTPSVQGLVEQRNALLGMAETEWIAWVDDDDLLLPNHIETLMAHLDGADLVYTWPKGPQPFDKWDVTDWSQKRLVDELTFSNGIPSCVAMRVEAVIAAGEWSLPQGALIRFEDHLMLYRLASLGFKFRCVPEETWVYRRGGWPRLTG